MEQDNVSAHKCTTDNLFQSAYYDKDWKAITADQRSCVTIGDNHDISTKGCDKKEHQQFIVDGKTLRPVNDKDLCLTVRDARVELAKCGGDGQDFQHVDPKTLGNQY